MLDICVLKAKMLSVLLCPCARSCSTWNTFADTYDVHLHMTGCNLWANSEANL